MNFTRIKKDLRKQRFPLMCSTSFCFVATSRLLVSCCLHLEYSHIVTYSNHKLLVLELSNSCHCVIRFVTSGCITRLKHFLLHALYVSRHCRGACQLSQQYHPGVISSSILEHKIKLQTKSPHGINTSKIATVILMSKIV